MLSSEKVAYLKGLADGLELGQETKQDRLITAIIDVLGAVARDIEALNTNNDDLAAEIDAVSDDLADIEKIVYEEFGCCEDEFCCEDDAEDEHECCCGGHDHDAEGEHECCCGGHDHDAEGEHECCCGDHDHDAEGEHECCCGGHGHLYDITCPGCNNHMTIDDRILAMGKVQCVHCGAMLEFGLDDESAQAAPEA